MELSERGQSLLKWALYAIVIFFSIMAVISISSGFIMDYYWFQSVGYLEVFMINIKYQLVLLFVGWAITTLFLLMSWRTVSKALANRVPSLAGNIFKIFSVFAGLGVGWWFKGKYLTVLKFLNQANWGVTDPVLGHDLSFYVFTLPLVKTVLMFVGVLSGLVIIFSIFTYGIGLSWIQSEEEEFEYSSRSNIWRITRFLKSWPILGSILALTVAGAISVWLGRFSYLWSFNPGASVPTGASYMAVHYLIPYTWVKAFGVLLLGILIIWSLLNLDEIREMIMIGDWGALKKEVLVVLSVIAIFAIIPGAVFGVISSFNVEPNEPRIQRPYIENTIYYTNQAYGLDRIQEVIYPSGSDNLTIEKALESPTVRNARIVDYRPSQQSFEQKQTLRTYYGFPDLDVDRYRIDGGKQLTIISGREMNYEGGGWQNQHLFFTHGYGAVITPANVVGPEGSPVLKVRDIPPVSEWPETELNEPRIYFGERTDGYAMVGADGLDEFDYPMGGKNVQNRYEFDRGIDLGSPWRKLISWFYTGDFKFMVSDYVGSESRLLLHRNVHERVDRIAPFLNYDPNAHLFVGDQGDLNYLLNGVATAERYPYSYSDSEAPGYLSDSVKAFVKTNTGDVEFFIVDENDPVARTYSNIYPSLFEDGDDMPEEYRNHLIYPESLFKVQMKIFERYHIEDYQTFYQEEDLWLPAQEKYHGLSKRIEPYNLLLDVTGFSGLENKEEEFTLVQPFTPEGKRNMRAWVGVAQDPGNYGKITAIKFPKGQLARGPEQVEDFIDQNTSISGQFTLWEGAGSRVLRGNLLVLPVKGEVLYIEPVYLAAEGGGVPQLKKVISVYGDRAVMENSLVGAVTSVLGRRIGPITPGENIIPGENLAPVELVQVVQEYLDLSSRYNELISEGKYAEAGRVRENMADLEERMSELTG